MIKEKKRKEPEPLSLSLHKTKPLLSNTSLTCTKVNVREKVSLKKKGKKREMIEMISLEFNEKSKTSLLHIFVFFPLNFLKQTLYAYSISIQFIKQWTSKYRRQFQHRQLDERREIIKGSQGVTINDIWDSNVHLVTKELFLLKSLKGAK